MSLFKNTWIATAWAWATYGGLNLLKNSWGSLSEFAWDVTEIIDMTASWVINTLSNTGIQIGDFAPLSDTWLAQLWEALTSASLWDFVVSSGVWLVWGYLWGAATNLLGKVTKTESEADNKIGKYWAWIATAVWMIWAWTMWVTVWSATAGYIVWKKIAQKVMDEKYARYIWLLTWAAATSVAWWFSGWTILGSALVLGWGKMIWDLWKPMREKQRHAKEQRKQASQEKKRIKREKKQTRR